MLSAVKIENDTVTNMIYIDEANMALFNEMGIEVIDPSPWGLTMGDYREGESWFRDIDGVKTELPIPEPESNDYEAYYNAISTELEGTK